MRCSKGWKRLLAFLLTLTLLAVGLEANGETAQAAPKSVKSISLSIDGKNVARKTVTIYNGVKKKLKVTVSPRNAKKKIAFASSKPSVASVSSKGVVTAKKAGTSQIKVTVTGKNNQEKSSYIKVKVKAASLVLDKKAASVQAGKNLTLKATVSPKQKIKWTTSDSKVATVSAKGVVKAKKAGTAKITARAGKQKAVCRITVTAAGIRFKNSFIRIAVDGDWELKSLLKLEGVKYKEKTRENKEDRNYDIYTEKMITFHTYSITVAGKMEITSSNPKVVQVQSSYSDYNNQTSVIFDIRNISQAAGTATLTAKLNGKKTKCKVVVTDPKIDRESTAKFIGKSQKLSVTGTSGKVTWKSENKAIAKVDSKGNVTAVGVGTTNIDAKVDGKILRCAFTTDVVPQFLNTYKLKKSKGDYTGDDVVVLADTVLRTSQAKKLDTVTDAAGKTVTTYDWQEVGDITNQEIVDFTAGNVYPVFDLDTPDEYSDYYVTEIYLVGASQNAVIRQLDKEIGGGTDVYWEYTPGEGMGMITIYAKDSSPALYSVSMGGEEFVFATYCREKGYSEPTDKLVKDKETENYVRQKSGGINIDTSNIMVAVAKYIVDKAIEVAINRLIDKCFLGLI